MSQLIDYLERVFALDFKAPTSLHTDLHHRMEAVEHQGYIGELSLTGNQPTARKHVQELRSTEECCRAQLLDHL